MKVSKAHVFSAAMEPCSHTGDLQRSQIVVDCLLIVSTEAHGRMGCITDLILQEASRRLGILVKNFPNKYAVTPRINSVLSVSIVLITRPYGMTGPVS